MAATALRLYEATDALAIVREWLEEEENIAKLIAAGGDIAAVPELAELLEHAEGTFKEKAERVGLYIRELLAEAKAIEEEEKRLAARRKAKKEAAEGLKGYLFANMKAAGLTKVEGRLLTVAIQKSGPSVRGELSAERLKELADKDSAFVRVVPACYELDKRAVLDWWRESPSVIPRELTVEQGESLRLR